MLTKKTNHKKTIAKLMAAGLIATNLLMPQVESHAAIQEAIYGKDRYETNKKVNEKAVLTESETVILASGDVYPDALSAGNIAYLGNAPLVLVKNDAKKVTEALKDYKKVKEIIIVGGETTISGDIATELTKKYSVKRLSGNDRYETSERVYEELKTSNNDIKRIGVRGDNFADALSAVPYAAKNDAAVILSNKEDNKFDAIVGGNVKGVSEKIIKGENRYETSQKVVAEFKEDPVVLAEGVNFPDALSASTLAGKNKANILLVNPTLNDKEKELIHTASSYEVIGGSVKDIIGQVTSSRLEFVKKQVETLKKEVSDAEEQVNLAEKELKSAEEEGIASYIDGKQKALKIAQDNFESKKIKLAEAEKVLAELTKEEEVKPEEKTEDKKVEENK